METTKSANTPDRYLATEVELAVSDGGGWEWVDDECAGCGGVHRYSGGDSNDDPRRKLGPRTAPCAKPESGTTLATAAEALNLSFGVFVLTDSDEDQTRDLMKVVRLMEFAGLTEIAGDGDDACTSIEGVLA